MASAPPSLQGPQLSFRQLLEHAAALHEQLAAENASLHARLSLGEDSSKDWPVVRLAPCLVPSDTPVFLRPDVVHDNLPESRRASPSFESAYLSDYGRLDAEKRDNILKKFDELNAACLQSNLSVADALDQKLLEEKVGAQGDQSTRCTNESWMSEEDDVLPSSAEVAKTLNFLNGRVASNDTLEQETFFDIMVMEELDGLLLESEVEKIQCIRNMFARSSAASHAAGTMDFSKELDVACVDDEPQSFATRVGLFMDPLSFFVILLNATTMAVSTDYASEWTGWATIELFFTAFFLIEILLKVHLQGPSQFVFGSEWGWNAADSMIVMCAVIDSVVTIVLGITSASMQTVTLMRLMRLVRILRVIRLLHFEIFKELLLMVRGVLAGVRTLCWAIVILLFVIFCLSLFMRQTVGLWCSSDGASMPESWCTVQHLRDYGEALFGSLARSCFTVFRCLTDGCSSHDGTPLMVHIYQNGWLGMCMALLYSVVYLCVTFGLFNLIMAVFVETTMESAKFDERRRRRARQKEMARIGQKLKILFIHLSKFERPAARSSALTVHTQSPASFLFNLMKKGRRSVVAKEEAEISAQFEASLDVKITRGNFAAAAATPEVEALLDELEVQVSDHVSLFDTLDADGGGSLDVNEIIKGIMRLRGPADKSDVVACLLSVRSMRKHLRRFEGSVMAALKNLRQSQEHGSTSGSPMLQVRQS